ncbi:hypothetical protein F2P81_021133 [Scophthalmus maximus]|uniref:Uncharacterized protein n=1 Tax=Scophthalmus maximus TaxID=52904 RepID=A0A6A4RUL3_SCOMX|nr:hypothetical protein F2P81_021133 [Scophthalmus maximus]
MDELVAAPQNLDSVTGHQSISPSLSPAAGPIHAHRCFSIDTFLSTPYCAQVTARDDDMTDKPVPSLPQVRCGFHIDEAGVFAELPVHVVGDPPLPVIGINHFPGRKIHR